MLGSFTQMGREEEKKRRRGQSVNLCIIRQCSESERKRGITKMWLSQQNHPGCLCLVTKKSMSLVLKVSLKIHIKFANTHYKY